MRVLRSSGVIAAQRDSIFALLEDPKMADQLDPDYLRIEVVEAPWIPKPSARAHARVLYRGARFELMTEITEYRRGYFLLERQVDGPFLSFERAVNLEDDDAGTRVTEILAYSVRFHLLGRAFDWLALRRDLEDTLARRLERLRELMETPV